MDNGTLAAVPGEVSAHAVRMRIGAAVAALSLLFAMVILVQERADAAPGGGSAAAAVSIGSGAAQIDFNAIICSTFLAVRNAFLNSPFFAFVAAAINPILQRFGCVISPG